MTMKHIDMNIVATRRRLMRRVWYSYLLSILSRTAFVHGFVLGGSVAMFGRLTHVAAITDNLLRVPVSSIPEYISQTITAALSGGEVLTVLVTLLLVSLTVSALVRLGVAVTHLKAATA